MANSSERVNTPPSSLYDYETRDEEQFIPVPCVLFPGGIEPGSLGDFHIGRTSSVLNPDGTPYIVNSKNPVVRVYTNNEINERTDETPVMIYYVPKNVFVYFRSLLKLYNDLGREEWYSNIYVNYDDLEDDEFFTGKVERVNIETMSLVMNDEYVSPIYNYLGIQGMLSATPISVSVLAMATHWYLLKLQDPDSSLRLSTGTYEPNASDYNIISNFFGGNYIGAENQKEFIGFLLIDNHRYLGGVEFEDVLASWFSNELYGKALDEMRVLTGAVDDIRVYNPDGSVATDEDGSTILVEEAYQLMADYPTATVKMMTVEGTSIPDDLRKLTKADSLAKSIKKRIGAGYRALNDLVKQTMGMRINISDVRYKLDYNLVKDESQVAILTVADDDYQRLKIISNDVDAIMMKVRRIYLEGDDIDNIDNEIDNIDDEITALTTIYSDVDTAVSEIVQDSTRTMDTLLTSQDGGEGPSDRSSLASLLSSASN